MKAGSKMLGEDRISGFIRYAGHDLPLLENKFQMLSGHIIDLQWKKKHCQYELAILGSTISQQKLTGLQMEVTSEICLTLIPIKRNSSTTWIREESIDVMSLISLCFPFRCTRFPCNPPLKYPDLCIECTNYFSHGNTGYDRIPVSS
jgi:hypothetical protein